MNKDKMSEFPITLTLYFKNDDACESFLADLLDGTGENMACYSSITGDWFEGICVEPILIGND